MKRFLFLGLISLCFLLPLAAQNQQSYVEHKVRWMETLYSIARKYKVEAKEIALFNNLRNGDVRRGQILRIPIIRDIPQENEYLNEDPAQKEEVAEAEEIVRAKPSCSDYVPYASFSPTISLLLPMSGNYRLSFVEFYQGALMAAKEMKALGMNATLHCYDWGAYTNPDILLSSEELSASQLIIGPIFSSEIGRTVAFFKGTDVKIVSPLDQNAEAWVSSSPNLFQIQPPHQAQIEAIIRQLSPNTASIWVISEQGDQQVAPEIHQLLNQHQIPFHNFSYDVLNGREVTSQLKTMMEGQKKNQIIIASHNEAFVSDALRNLHLLFAYNNIPIELYGLSKWRGFETLDLNALHQLQVVLPMPFFIDYAKTEVQDFVRQYRALFASEPSQYAFQGYDITLYFMNALLRFGPYFEDCLALSPMNLSLLQSSYRFERISKESGFTNNGIRLIRYLPDFTIETLPASK